MENVFSLPACHHLTRSCWISVPVHSDTVVQQSFSFLVPIMVLDFSHLEDCRDETLSADTWLTSFKDCRPSKPFELLNILDGFSDIPFKLPTIPEKKKKKKEDFEYDLTQNFQSFHLHSSSPPVAAVENESPEPTTTPLEPLTTHVPVTTTTTRFQSGADPEMVSSPKNSWIPARLQQQRRRLPTSKEAKHKEKRKDSSPCVVPKIIESIHPSPHPLPPDTQHTRDFSMLLPPKPIVPETKDSLPLCSSKVAAAVAVPDKVHPKKDSVSLLSFSCSEIQDTSGCSPPPAAVTTTTHQHDVEITKDILPETAIPPRPPSPLESCNQQQQEPQFPIHSSSYDDDDDILCLNIDEEEVQYVLADLPPEEELMREVVANTPLLPTPPKMTKLEEKVVVVVVKENHHETLEEKPRLDCIPPQYKIKFGEFPKRNNVPRNRKFKRRQPSPPPPSAIPVHQRWSTTKKKKTKQIKR